MYPDPYHDAAMIGIELICDNNPQGCQGTLGGHHLEGQPTYPEDGWDAALGDEARKRGWLIEQLGEKPFDFLILCPHCAKIRSK